MPNLTRFFCAVLVFSFATLTAFAQNPKLYSVSPNQIRTGAAAFPIVVSGSNFAKNSQIQINGVALDTLAVSRNKLRATVPANLAATAVVLQVKVVRRELQSNSAALSVLNSLTKNYNWAALNQKLQTFVPNTVNGLTLQISRNGTVLYTQAFGNQTINSVLQIASSSKMPAMTAILTLVDEQRLNLDAPISTYLNGFVVVPADKANITMRMLMNHISGFEGADDAACLSDRNTTLQACAQEILNLPLASVPGTKFDYGGNSMQLAGYVAEVISGQSWNNLFDSKIRTPLSLTRFTYGSSQNPRIAGGARSDVGDYTRILQSYLAGGVYADTRIISKQTYYEMQTDQKRDLPVINNPGGDRLNGYSYGWWHSAPGYLQQQPLPQTPGLELSDPGAFGCTPWIDFEYNYTAILLINSNVPTATTMLNGVRPLIIEQMQNNR